ncbi:glycosyltransferase family protein [Klebsiella quasipneumoniae]|uniref:hypothetical protein n=2 Tax=Klebsiella quasipneumoniae TaxID=1463165 RepID=UPI0007CC8D34|nr:hypothetical protein [Klebsiella quasipneumoniae]MCK6034672.1 hypothetical protein [Klebsiella quasipneumoniae]PLJ04847.1 hypothetical protein B6J58_09435 [Klebsiella quasipneumoniae]SAU37802.1 Uncharacterised protein [Klebsiella quasipneumoniae]SXC67728.1 Uncharacterised protein [Klebsiella quasipneumoniae]HDG7920008.1 hypothetical protein [Klebsiella quasipneumoniae]
MNKISYYPFKLVDNNYTENFKDILSSVCRTDICGLDFKDTVNDLVKGNFKKNNVVILNWMENELVHKNGKVVIIGVLKSFAKMLILKMAYKRVVYVRHNLYPHNTIKKHVNIARYLTTLLASIADLRISHSPVFKDKMGEVLYIPHPLYKITLKDNYNECPNDRYVVFGNIARYKKIEELIKAFPINKKLLIFGGCKDQEYLETLNSLILDKNNIEISARFFSDEEAASIIKASNGMIISHAEDDMIVSGSFFYGLSCEVKLLVIETPFLRWSSGRLSEQVVEVFSDIKGLCAEIEKETIKFNCYSEFDKKVIDELFSNETIGTSLEKII